MRDWLSHRVVSSPNDPALVRAEDGETWTYAQLDGLVSETAGRLAARGIEEGDHVGVLMPAYVGTIGLVHASMRLGATFVPFGERLTPRELAERVELADVTTLICAESTEADAVAAAGDVPVLSVDEPTTDEVDALHDVDPVPIDLPQWSDDDRLCLLFTSGTTGDPKAVELTAGNVFASAVASGFRLGVDPNDRWLVSLALNHMGGLAPIYRSALYGTTVVLREGFDPGGVADDIDRYDATGVSLVPTMLQRALDSRGTLSDSLRVVLLGGAPAPDELIKRCRDYSIPVYPTYGMTEAASQIATATPDQANDRLGTVGRPLFGTDVTVVDEGGPVEPGETGEFVVSGPTITPGYYGDPDANEDAFGEHGLHTGDCGRVDENGYLYVLNRIDDRIITGGENVEPGEVADVFRRHEDVVDVAVVGLEDEVWGERVSALIAVGDEWGGPRGTSGSENERSESVVVDGAESSSAEPASAESASAESASTGRSESIIDESDVFSFARDRLAGFKMPRTVAYVDRLPRTVSGTVDRQAVQEILWDRGFDPEDPNEEFADAGFEPVEPVDPDSTSQDTGESDETGDKDGSAEANGSDDSDETRDSDESDEPDETDETTETEGPMEPEEANQGDAESERPFSDTAEGNDEASSGDDPASTDEEEA